MMYAQLKISPMIACIFVFLLLALSPQSLVAQEVSSNLDSLEAVLEASVKQHQMPQNAAYLHARGKLEDARNFQEKMFGKGDLVLLLPAVQASVQAAIADMELQRTLAVNDALQQARIQVLSDITGVQNQITLIEKGHASSLAQDLEAQKKLTEAERAKAEAIRLEALKHQQDAENRLKDLQSELINVRTDARGIILSMSDILFAVNKADLTGDLKTSLAKIAGILTVYKESHVLVEGHTDITGAAEYNLQLSRKRAENVKEFLVQQGLAEERMEAIGFGETKPVATNDTKEGRQKNRRVDLVISDDKLR